MSIIGLIIVGAAAGFLATRLMHVEANIWTTMSIGIAGALIGGVVLRALMAVMGLAAGFVGALLGALLLVWFWQRYNRR